MPDFRRASLALALSAAMLALGSCRDSSSDSERFKFVGRLFVFNYRVATATYLVNLEPLGPVEDGQTAVATFEDPAGGDPIVVRRKIWPKMARTTIESPPIRCVVKNRPYAVSVAIEDASGKVVQTLTTTMKSDVDQTVLPDVPLVVGSGYTPNPALAGHPGGRISGVNTDCPA